MRAWLFLPFVLAACDRSAERNGASPAQIANMSNAEAPIGASDESARLDPLRPGDPITEDGGCDFSQGHVVYLVSSGSDTVARVAGQLVHLVPSGPVGETGGFFEERQISISVGRVEQVEAGHPAGSWPARVGVTNRRTGAQAQMRGMWTCLPGRTNDERR